MVFLRDVRYSLRLLRRTPGFTIAAVAALTLGIGANTAIFSVVNTVLLKPLTYPDSGRIVQFLVTFPDGSGTAVSVTKFNLWRQLTGVFECVSAYNDVGPVQNLTGGDSPMQVKSIHVTADFFQLFGARVIHGRTFTAEEDRPNAGHFAVLSYGLWQSRFGGDAGIVGKTIQLGGNPHEVVGIIGPDFVADPPADVWLPFQFDPNSTDQAHYFLAAARLKPGVSLEAANARLALAFQEFRRKFTLANPKSGFRVQPLEESIVSDVRPSLLVLLGAVGFVLLIACANVANLLLMRAAARKREIAIRAAVGASRGRIVGQLLTESILLALAGGASGTVLGAFGVQALLAVSPGNIPRIGEHGEAVTMDWRVLLFTAVLSLFTGVLFGLIPALGVSRADLGSTLKESGGRSGTGFRQNKARSLLVVSEVALALVLLIGAALLIRSFVALRSVDAGFDRHNVLTLEMSLSGERFSKSAGVAQIARESRRRLNALPGVIDSATTCCLPLEGGFGLPFIVAGRPLGDQPAHGGAGWISVSPGYFEVFRIPLIRGRTFDDRDGAGAPLTVVINQAMAREYWPKGDPLGDQIIIGRHIGPEFEEGPRQIVGITGDVRDNGLNRNPRPQMYIPLAQVPDGVTALNARMGSMAWVVRTRAEPQAMARAIEKELGEASGGLPAGRVRSMDQIVVSTTARENFNMLLLTIFGVSALLLAAIGIYGLMAYSVEQRTQEIGIRMALGAGGNAIRNMVVQDGVGLALAGVAIGLLAAVGMTRVIASFLFGVKALDPLVFTAVPLLLTAVAVFAAWLPARRATRIDPLEALRHE